MALRCNGLFALLTVSVLLLISAAAYRWPRLKTEDGIMETGGAVAFFFAALLMFVASMRQWRAWLRRKAVLTAALAIGCLTLFLSEISFGARIFALDMPKLNGGGEFDGAHDVFIVFLRRLEAAETSLGAAASTAAGVLTGLFLLGCLARTGAIRRAKQQLSDPVAFRLATAAAALAGAVVLDLLPGDVYAAHVLEEALEFVAAGILLALAARLLRAEGGFRPAGASAPAADSAPGRSALRPPAG